MAANQPIARVDLRHGDDGFYFEARIRLGTVVFTSETYARKGNAMRAIRKIYGDDMRIKDFTGMT